MIQKPDKDKKPHQCPHCGSPNGEWASFGEWAKVDHVMYCMDCDSTWFEYENSWNCVNRKGKIIQD